MLLIPCLAVALVGPRLGLAICVPEGGGEEEFIAAARQQIRMGLDGAVLSLKWDEMESQNGKPLSDGLGLMKLTGQEGLLTIATLDTIKRRLPGDLAEKAWDDPVMLARWEGFVGAIVPKLDKRVHWISLGNEVDGYLAQHSGEIPAFMKFLAAGKAAVKKTRPDIQVGVTVMCMDGMKQKDLLRQLQTGMDITIFTYYPNSGGTSAAEMSAVGSHFDFMLDIAGPRPLLLQEIGYPASVKTGGSEEKQAQFVKAIFAQIDRNAAKIPLAAYFMQCDFPPSMMGMIEQYYGISDPTFLSFLGSLGLMDSNGKPRQAWKVFQEEVSKRKPLT